MKKSIRKILLLMSVMCLVLGIFMLASCNIELDDGTSDKTTVATTVEIEDTEEAETTAAPEETSSAAVSEESTTIVDSTTEAASDEATSEPEESTEAATYAMPSDATVVTFCDMPQNSSIISASNTAKYEIVNDAKQGEVLKLSVIQTKKDTVCYAKIEYASYMKLAGLQATSWSNCAYAVALVKVEGISNSAVSLTAAGLVNGKSKTVTAQSTYKTNNSDWQYIIFPIAEEGEEGILASFRFEFANNPKTAGEAVYLKSISFVKTKAEAVAMAGTSLINPSLATVVIPGLTKEYRFLHITDTHVAAFSDNDIYSWTATRLNYNLARKNAFVADGLYSEERFPLLFDYAQKINADGLFLTGDLIDFPSEKNVQLLYDNATRTGATPIFCLGNHDWNYSDDYMTSNAYATYKPLFTELCGGDPDISVQEYDEFMVVAIDNSADVVTQSTVDKFMALYAKNKPIILLLHVPLHADTLAPDVMAAWGGRNITMGIGAMGNDWQSVRDFYTAVCLNENTPVVAVFAGHVHFNHEDTFPNGVKQYVTSAGYFGDCRVVTVKGTN